MLNRLIAKGDFNRLRQFYELSPFEKRLVNRPDYRGRSPLYNAVAAIKQNVDIVKYLLDIGADPSLESPKCIPALYSEGNSGDDRVQTSLNLEVDQEVSNSGTKKDWLPVVQAAIRGESVEIIELLRASGADLSYQDEHGYTAVLNAVYGYGDRIPVIRYLIGLGLDLNVRSVYDECAVKFAYECGRFEVLDELIIAGADEKPLKWSALHRAVSTGRLNDVMSALAVVDEFSAWDCCGRNALQLGIARGNLEAVQLLIQHGFNLSEKSEDGTSSLSFAVLSRNLGVVAWALAFEWPIEDKNSALVFAVQENLYGIARALLEAGADANPATSFGTLLEDAPNQEMLMLLYSYGADLAELDAGGRRKLLGVDQDEDVFNSVSKTAYETNRYAREGTANPDDISDPFRMAMVRCGFSADRAREHYNDTEPLSCGLNGQRSPTVWCFDRRGQSTTVLPDGRTILIGGEHDDFYDPDFCIYNDVAVFHPDRSIRLFGYPFSVFPPTDFHTATRVGQFIYIIGALGYEGTREGPIPIYRLSTETFQIEKVETTGAVPTRIFDHRATLFDESVIRIQGGSCFKFEGSREKTEPNPDTFELDLRMLTWRLL